MFCKKPAWNVHHILNVNGIVQVICSEANGDEGYETYDLTFSILYERGIQACRTNTSKCTETTRQMHYLQI